jgi:hypothetical protein
VRGCERARTGFIELLDRYAQHRAEQAIAESAHDLFKYPRLRFHLQVVSCQDCPKGVAAEESHLEEFPCALRNVRPPQAHHLQGVPGVTFDG